ncbi:MAG: electron transport complex subunit RsxC [Rhodocyclaceae bacterium]|nr:electron transport complex subunit RsxC [Rhodocyclaceae bacterium]
MNLFKFNGGVKPDYHKDESVSDPIAKAPLPSQLVIPLHQSIGGIPHPLVRPGQKVLKGERIGAADGNVSSAVHASTSGKVIAVEPRLMPHPSGLSALCVVIEPDGEERWIEKGRLDVNSTPPDVLRDFLRDAGVVGLGGAVFPSHLKLKAGKSGGLEALIINGAECEPYITCDDLLMREQAETIVKGAATMQTMLTAKTVLIGIEDNKPEAFEAMKAAVAKLAEKTMEVVMVPTRYPAGGAKQLIRVLTGKEVPHGTRSTDYGVQCFNVATALSIYRALEYGEPLISRIVTVTGNVGRARNYEVLLGTPVSELVALADPRPDTNRLIMGGPMMGFTLPGNTPVVKATNCIIAGSPKLFPEPPPEMPCIRCGSCSRACPHDLQPFELYWFSRSKNFGKAQEYFLFDCIECGCCSYVCPSNIPLVDYFRFAKSEIWAREKDKDAADSARVRFEFRTEREEREKAEKAARLAAKTAAALEAAAKAQAAAPAPGEAAAPAADPAAEAKKALIAAALEKARAQKEQVHPANTEHLTPAQEAQVNEAEARRAQAARLAETAGKTTDGT